MIVNHRAPGCQTFSAFCSLKSSHGAATRGFNPEMIQHDGDDCDFRPGIARSPAVARLQANLPASVSAKGIAKTLDEVTPSIW
jgi:hypothetical protein